MGIMHKQKGEIQCMHIEIMSQECSLGDPLPKFLKYCALLNKMVARAKKIEEVVE